MDAWLHGLGLEQYAPAFRDNDVDSEVLPQLTVDDLISLGVTSVGHRRKLLAAIASLGAAASAAAATVAPRDTPAPADAERRQLTVMFCDLVGSTALSARFDPEELREEIRAYQNAVSGVVARYDGFVAKYMGDGVLVGEGSAQEQAVVGETPNLAARLQALAEPGQIVLAGATRRLIGDLFRLSDLGRQAVKGFAEPVEAFTVEGVAVAESRFEAARRGLTDLVGRAAESALLRDHLRAAWAGAGQIVLLSGEAGIGKSRLAAQLAAEVANEPHTRLRYQCSPYHRDSVLHPLSWRWGAPPASPPRIRPRPNSKSSKPYWRRRASRKPPRSLLPCCRSRRATAIRCSH
jgi:class 3 adenylate cyclase